MALHRDLHRDFLCDVIAADGEANDAKRLVLYRTPIL